MEKKKSSPAFIRAARKKNKPLTGLFLERQIQKAPLKLSDADQKEVAELLALMKS